MVKQLVNILIANGGLGDLLCSLVAVDYNVKTYTNVTFLVWVPDYLLDFAKHVLPRGTSVRNYTEAKTKYNETLPAVSTKWSSFHTPMRTHPVDYAFHVLSDKHIYSLNEKNYLQINPEKINIKKFQLPEKYVVLGCASVEPVKEMPIQTMNEIIDFVISKGYTPVFLGKTLTKTGYKDLNIKAKALEVDYSKGINLIDKTSLLESAAILSGSKSFIGMDGGLLHLAGCTYTNIVAGFTIVSPSHIAPIRYGMQKYKFYAIEPDENIPNRYYQTNNNFDYNTDYRKFPGWEKVVENLTSDKFIKVLEEIL